jgi:hypothetical protein
MAKAIGDRRGNSVQNDNFMLSRRKSMTPRDGLATGCGAALQLRAAAAQ